MKRKFFPLIIIISALFLFACGLTNRVIDEGSQAIVDLVQEEIQIEPTASEEPQQPEDTENTQTPSAQVMRIETDSACYHPLFPVVEGAYWTYQYPSGDRYTLTIDQTGVDTFTMTQEFYEEDTIFSVDWYCSDEGLLQGSFAQVDILDQATGDDNIEINFEALDWEGQTLPPFESMQIGKTWVVKYTMSGETTIGGFSTTLIAIVEIEYIVSAIEEITVPAGTFDGAYRIDSTGDIAISMGTDDANIPMNVVNYTFTTWYVEDIGMIKGSNDLIGESTTIELIDSSLLK